VLLSIFGTPSPLTYWMLRALEVVVRVVDPRAGFIRAGGLDELSAAWQALDERSREHVVFFSDYPETGITELFVSAGVPIIFVADEPGDLVSFILESRSVSVEEAIRFSSQSLSALAALSESPAVWNIRKDACANRTEDQVRAIAEFFGLAPGEDQFDEIFRQLMTHDRGLSSVGDEIGKCVGVSHWPTECRTLDEGPRYLTERILTPYQAVLRGEPLDRVHWPAEFFFNSDNPGSLLSGPQDLTGKARFLIHGPYLHLPRGKWKARVEIEVAENLSGNQIRSDVVSGGTVRLAAITAQLPRQGVFAFEICFSVDEPLLPLEIRIQILEGAIEGVLLLRSVLFERQRDPLEMDRGHKRYFAIPSEMQMEFGERVA